MFEPATTKEVPMKESMMIPKIEFRLLNPRDTTLHIHVATHSTTAPNITGTFKT